MGTEFRVAYAFEYVSSDVLICGTSCHRTCIDVVCQSDPSALLHVFEMMMLLRRVLEISGTIPDYAIPGQVSPVRWV